MKAIREGRMPLSERVVSHWEMCLQCLGCQEVCPSGVPYSTLMNEARLLSYKTGKASFGKKFFHATFVQVIVPRQWLMSALMRVVWLYQKSRLQALLRLIRFFSIMPARVRELDAQLPPMPARFFGPSSRVYAAKGQAKHRVGLLSGCIMPLVQSPVMEATIRVLNRNGCDVVVPRGQGCCGAINEHDGDFETARRLARRNIDVFLAAGVDAIVTNSAGCGLAMKEYGNLLADDPAYAEKARKIAAMSFDINEYLVKLPFEAPKSSLNLKVTWHDPCHLAHGQKIREQPRTILRSIPGVKLVEMRDADMCCGAAGIYMVTNRDMSKRLLEAKMNNATATQADVMATSNPGCSMQIQMGLVNRGSKMRVAYAVELLDEAYRAER
jgi:Fe-S oxidoreductase